MAALNFTPMRVHKKDPSPYGHGTYRVSEILDLWDDDPEERLKDWTASLGYNWREERSYFADIGTLVHEMIEDNLKPAVDGHPFDGLAPIQRWASARPVLKEKALNAYRAYLSWSSKFTEFAPTAIEDKIYSPTINVGGTCDFKGILNGKKTMIDWKSSRKISRRYKVQIAAYDWLDRDRHLRENPGETYVPFERWGVARFDRNGDGYEAIFWDNIDKARAIFSGLVTLNQMINARPKLKTKTKDAVTMKGEMMHLLDGALR